MDRNHRPGYSAKKSVSMMEHRYMAKHVARFEFARRNKNCATHPTATHKNRKKRGHVSAGHGRIGKHRKHPGGRGNAGGQHHHRILFDKFHPGYFGKVGMRQFHLLRNRYHCPTVNVEKLWSLVSAQVKETAEKAKDGKAPIIDVTKAGYFKVLGKGRLPAVPVIVKAKYFSQEAENKIKAIKGTFEAAKAVVDDPASLLHLHSEDLNATLSQVRIGCVQLQHTITSHDDSFLALDVFRVNQARHRFARWKVPSHDHGALHKAHVRVEGHLRKVLGAAAFQNHADLTEIPPTRTFTEWHDSVVSLLASVASYETLLEIDAKGTCVDNTVAANVRSTREDAASRNPAAPLQLEDSSCDSRSPVKRKRLANTPLTLAELRQCWVDGLRLREADEAAAAQAEKDAVRAQAVERMALRSAQEKHRLDRYARKLSIWEAVVEGTLSPQAIATSSVVECAGWPVEKINQLAIAETKTAAQHGNGAFRLRDSQAENGRTLLQLACWCGSCSNTASPATSSTITATTLSTGRLNRSPSKYLDRRFLRAARRNHVETIQALLDLPLKEIPTAASAISPVHIARWRSVLAANHRGKRPIHLTTLHRVRTMLLVDFERVAETGLELYNRQGASEAAMLRRRDGLAPSTVKRTPTLTGRPSRDMERQRTRVDVADPSPSSTGPMDQLPAVDGRRQREFRVKKATARAVKNFEKEGRKRANVQLAGQRLKYTLQHTSSAFSIETDDMDIFLDHVAE
ncbi:hypothetical protein DYB32_006186 [Aphanomyces invadans]|uniref:Large ribosomal subunit protein uL15/eL18 domain-containing protein n=1 Tax=Aphanomyces invadans TaxID=157072 RepID=A0A3R6V8Y4_9STRA|nr:hypothetical protein DYB32_006186 [Aphanomyces invadans]